MKNKSSLIICSIMTLAFLLLIYHSANVYQIRALDINEDAITSSSLEINTINK